MSIPEVVIYRRRKEEAEQEEGTRRSRGGEKSIGDRKFVKISASGILEPTKLN